MRVMITLVAVSAWLVNRHGHHDVVPLYQSRRKLLRDALPVGGLQERGKGQFHISCQCAVFSRLGSLRRVP